MKNIDYSIIIPHKNTPQLLKRCLDSIPVCDNVEVIIVDDNSDPNIVDFVNFPGTDRYNTKIIFSHSNLGAGHARNLGLEECKGKWLLFSDSDDFFVEDLNQILEKCKNFDEDLIYFNVNSVLSEDTSILANRNLHKKKLFDLYHVDPIKGEMYFRLLYHEPWGKLIKRTLIEENKICFDETKVCNDQFFSTKVGCNASKILILDIPLYTITVRTASLSYAFADSMEKIITRLRVAVNVQLYIAQFGYEISPMPIRFLMILLLRQDLKTSLVELSRIRKLGISIIKLIYEIAYYKFKDNNELPRIRQLSSPK